MVDPKKISLDDWEVRYDELRADGLAEASYGGRLSRHVADGDFRLETLAFDNSAAALGLWNFLLTEEDRLRQAKTDGRHIIGTMKDLGTIPVMAYSLPNTVAFYPDGAWWIPCVMEMSAGLLRIADEMGIDESFCPVRAMLGAFATEAHFPLPDQLFCSVGATCDDFSAIAQRLNGMGHEIFWWEIPHRREADPGEDTVALPGGYVVATSQVEFVESELARVKAALEAQTGEVLTDACLHDGIRLANSIRSELRTLREAVFTAQACPLPALELLIAEMLAIHYCSDREECLAVLKALNAEVSGRIAAGKGVLDADAVRVFWINPIADLKAMNALEGYGCRLCGTDFMFCHALDPIPEDLAPLTALAQTALSDPMVGACGDRAKRICQDAVRYGAEAVVISKIPGASHCAFEGLIIGDMIERELQLPVVQLEIPPLSDSFAASISTRLEALGEAARQRRKK